MREKNSKNIKCRQEQILHKKIKEPYTKVDDVETKWKYGIRHTGVKKKL